MSAQRQVDDLRSRLAEAHSNWQLAQAAAAAAEQERAELLQQASQQLNRASLVEQVCACSWFVGGATSCTCVAALILLAAAAVEQRTFARQQDKSFSSCIQPSDQSRLPPRSVAHAQTTCSRLVVFTQALQQVFRQEVSNSRARVSQLQETLHQRSADLDAARAQLVTAQEERAAAVAEQQRREVQLDDALHRNMVLQQQMEQVTPAWLGSAWLWTCLHCDGLMYASFEFCAQRLAFPLGLQQCMMRP